MSITYQKRVIIMSANLLDGLKLRVSKHIDEYAAGLTPQFTIFPFYKILSPSEVMRKNKERFFISKYKPVLNDLKLR